MLFREICESFDQPLGTGAREGATESMSAAGGTVRER